MILLVAWLSGKSIISLTAHGPSGLCDSEGKDEREAMEEAINALGSDLSIRLSRREEIPTPSAAKRGQRLVSVPLWLAPKLALYLAMRDQQVNNSELARRLALHERVIRRMLDPEHATKAEKIQAALAVLGKQLTVEVHDAASYPGHCSGCDAGKDSIRVAGCAILAAQRFPAEGDWRSDPGASHRHAGSGQPLATCPRVKWCS